MKSCRVNRPIARIKITTNYRILLVINFQRWEFPIPADKCAFQVSLTLRSYSRSCWFISTVQRLLPSHSSVVCWFANMQRLTDRDITLRVHLVKGKKQLHIGRHVAKHFCSSDKPVCLPFANYQLSGWLYGNVTLFLTIRLDKPGFSRWVKRSDCFLIEHQLSAMPHRNSLYPSKIDKFTFLSKLGNVLWPIWLIVIDCRHVVFDPC